MSHEFWLQKKAFNSWSHVTWYPTEEECVKNFNRVAVEGNGYSWRMVKVEVVEERLLHDESPVMRPEAEDDNDDKAIQPVKSGWGANPTGSWTKAPVAASNSEHGMIGKVWLGNPVTKEKKRVEPAMVAAMMADGWIKAGPRTVL